jgi:hypothetical protein
MMNDGFYLFSGAFERVTNANGIRRICGKEKPTESCEHFVCFCLSFLFYFMTSWEFNARQHGMGGQVFAFDFKLYLGQRS